MYSLAGCPAGFVINHTPENVRNLFARYRREEAYTGPMNAGNW
jgi:hypothetical protein